MSNPNTYDAKELDTIVDAVRAKFRGKLAADPNFFGQDQAVMRRIAITLDDNAPRGTLAARENIDAINNSTPGIMRTVDLTILDHNAKTEDVEKVARRAADEHCATVCVYPEHVKIVARVMQEKGVTDVPPIAVVGFPSVPAPTPDITAQTVQQTRDAIRDGAKEIDMVLPTSFREDKGDYQDHFKYIKAVVDAAHENGIPVKVILETAYLTDRQIAKASVLSKIAGAEWVKTSTGFAEEGKLAKDKNIKDHKGATPHDVALMRRTVGDTSLDDNGNAKPIGVKASGGVRTRDQAIAVLQAGADRIGASGGIDVRTAAERVANQNAAQDSGKAAGGRSGY
jgi:deoxyribose-phosphate aldolase